MTFIHLISQIYELVGGSYLVIRTTTWHFIWLSEQKSLMVLSILLPQL